MKDNHERRELDTRIADDDDDVEIIEVVGIDEDLSIPAPTGTEGLGSTGEDLVLSFGDETEPNPGSSSDPAVSHDHSGAVAVADPAGSEDQLLRLRADYENLRKRLDRERRDYQEHANTSLVARLLPVLDNFARALNGREAYPDEASLEAFRDGVVMIYRHLMDELRREGLEPIEATGKPFDPTIHDAVETEHTQDAPSHRVLAELQRGYLFRNRVLRPALVRVSMDPAARRIDTNEDR